MILFKKLRYKNILSTGNLFTEIDLNQHSTTLVIGKNGSGKSTLIEALSFGVYGKPFRKINKPQLLNVITKKDLVVEIEFSVGKDDYKIIRGMKPNIFELYKNDQMLNQDATTRDYQQVLEEQILKINHKSFCQVIVLGTASFIPFMQLSAQARRDIIEDLLDLQIFTTMNVLLKEKIGENTNNIIQIVADKKITQNNLTMLQSHFENIQKTNVKFIDENKNKIESTEILIVEAEKEYQLLIEEGKALKETLSDRESIRSKLTKFDEYRVKFSEKKRSASKIIDFFHDNTTCPTCKQAIDDEFRNDTIETKEKIVKDIETGLTKLSKEKEIVDKKLEEFNTIAIKINDLSLTLSKINVKILSWKENIKSWQKEITGITDNNEFISQDRIDKVIEELNGLEKKNEQLLEQKSIYATTLTILKDGGIKSMIIKQYVPIINKLINKYLASMDFFVNFELNEQFEEKIKSRGRDEFSYASFSEGEKLRIDLAFLFTWRTIAKMRNSVHTNLLILDEVFDSSLDVNGAEEFLKILKNLADDNTFVISHRGDQMIDKFDNVISFQKIKNFSKKI